MNDNQAEPPTEASHMTDQSSKIGAIDRREYLKYASVLAGTPIVADHVSASEQNNSAEETKGDLPAPTDLHAEYEQNPTNLLPSTDQSPRFSWQLPATDRGVAQEAYQIRVGTEDDSIIDDADAWDSGRVDSARSTTVEYDGTPLEPDTTYYWSVRVWNTNGNQTQWSDPAHFTTAIPDSDEYWEGEWIGRESETYPPVSVADSDWIRYPEDNPQEEVSTGTLYFRNSFELPEDVEEVWIAGLARGEALVHVNGTPVKEVEMEGDANQAGPATIIRVTPALLQSGTNAVGAVVSMDESDPAELLLTLQVRYGNDDWETLLRTDGEWNVSEERVNGWSTQEFDTSSWESVQVLGEPEIDPDDVESPQIEDVMLSPLLRTEVTVEEPVKSARVHFVTLGYGELYVNGERIGEEQLNPAPTQYEERSLYTSHDISETLNGGENAIGLWLGRGFFSKTRLGLYGAPRAKLVLRIEFEDGETQTVSTSSDWHTSESPIVWNDIYTGEIYDARQEQEGWSEPGFDDTDWDSVDVVEPPNELVESPSEDMRLHPQRLPAIKAHDTFDPAEIVSRDDGYMIDFGQNMPGWLELTIRGADEGDEIRMTHAEVLHDGNFEVTRDLETGQLNLVDLEGAATPDMYIASGNDEETYEPRFTYSGFRYVLVEGYPGELSADDIQAKAVSTAFDKTGSFACSNEDLNQVQHNAVWGLRSNAMGHPTDNDQRAERLGWTGDVHQNDRADYYNWALDGVRFHEKWSRDHTDVQSRTQEGYVTNTVPVGADAADADPTDPNWSKTRVIIPWHLYLHTGDKRILEENYEGMRDYVDFWNEQAENNIIPAEFLDYGDWVAFEGQDSEDERRGNSDPALFNTFAHYQTTNFLAKAAAALDHEDDTQVYREQANAIAEAFHEEFFNPERNSYGTGTQTTYVLPLSTGIVPAEHEETVVANLAEKIGNEDDGKLQTGFIGTRPLIYTLVEYGYKDLAYNVVSQPEQPGWVYMTRQGATTLWERWNSDELIGPLTMNTFNHRPWTLISEWFYRVLAGINVGEPGFEHVEISPMVVEDLDWAEAETETVRGRIVSRWECVGSSEIELEVSIPGNTTATVKIPTLDSDKVCVRESNKTIWNNGNRTRPHHSGIEDVTREDDHLIVDIASGEYTFNLE